MTFIKTSVICDGCMKIVTLDEYEDSITDASQDPWVRVSPDVRGYSMVFTFCPGCAKKPMTIPSSGEIVRRTKAMLR